MYTYFSFQMVTSVAMQALHSMFLAEPKEKSLPAQLNAQLITVSFHLKYIEELYKK